MRTVRKRHLNKRRSIWRCAAGAVAAGVMLAVFASSRPAANAMFDKGQAVHIVPEDIEDSTLAVGAHLIYLGSLEEEIYSLAKQSAEDSGQTVMYYKSELGDGAWYEISSAGSLKDIMKDEKQINARVIRELYFTHHTRSDGVTYDLRSGETVNTFDIQDPYDPNTLPQLDELRRQISALKNGGTDMGLLEQFFKGKEKEEDKIKNKITESLDAQMDSLYRYSQDLIRSKGSAGKISTVQKAMKKVDDARRYEADRRILAKLSDLLDKVSASATLSTASDLMKALGDSIREVQAGMDEADANRLYTEEELQALVSGGNEENTGVILATSLVKQELIQELIQGLGEKGEDSGNETAGELLEQMESLDNILEGQSIDRDREKALLDSRVIPRARQLSEDSDNSAVKNELEYYEKLRAQMDEIPQDTRELNALYDERQRIDTLRMQALDEEDLTEANRLEALLKDVDGKIHKLEEAGVYADGSASQNIEDMKEGALTALDSAPVDSQEEASQTAEQIMASVEGIGALGGSNPQLAAGALGEIYQKLAARSLQTEGDSGDARVYRELLNHTEEVMSTNLPVFDETLDDAAILEAAEEVEGASLSGDDARENSAALAGIAMFVSQTGQAIDSPAAVLLEGRASLLSSGPESLVFQNPNAAPGAGYAPADKIASLCSFRYVWRENEKRAALVKGEKSYGFQAFSSEVKQGENKKAKMDAQALFQSVIYLPAAYVEQEFGCQVYDLAGTGYSTLLDKTAADKASQVCDAILKKGGD